MGQGTQAPVQVRPRIHQIRPRSEWPDRTATQPNGHTTHPTGTWRAQLTMTARNDGKRTITEQTQALQARIERWLGEQHLRSEVARIDPLEGRIAVFITCSSRCKHRLRTAFPDLESTSGATRVSHMT